MKKYRYSLFVSLVASLGAILFGYCMSVIAGAILFIVKQLHMSTLEQEIVVSVLVIGALIGALFGGIFSDKVGRKSTFFLTACLFLLGTMFLFIADSMIDIIIGRFITGLGIGVASVVVPLYIVEMSPTEHRGSFVSFNQLGIAMGILFAYSVNHLLAQDAHWQLMFGFAFIPATLLFVSSFFLPETPSFLASQGKMDEAKLILHRIHRGGKDEEVYVETRKSKPKEIVRWKHLFEKSVRPALYVGVVIAVFQQITGINAVIYYAPQIFQHAGFASASSATLATLGIGMINVVMTLVALWLVDIVGRRPLLIIGLSGMIFCLTVLGFAFLVSSAPAGVITVLCLMGYVAFFAIGLGVVSWLIISEIFPMGIRGRAMGFASVANWTFNFFVSLTFLSLVELLGISGAFLLYAVIGGFALWFIYRHVPETKGKSFEEIQKFWKRPAIK